MDRTASWLTVSIIRYFTRESWAKTAQNLNRRPVSCRGVETNIQKHNARSLRAASRGWQVMKSLFFWTLDCFWTAYLNLGMHMAAAKTKCPHHTDDSNEKQTGYRTNTECLAIFCAAMLHNSEHSAHFNINNIQHFAHMVFWSTAWFWEQTVIPSLNRTDQLVVLMEIQYFLK
jgi:hypothetical protein